NIKGIVPQLSCVVMDGVVGSIHSIGTKPRNRIEPHHSCVGTCMPFSPGYLRLQMYWGSNMSSQCSTILSTLHSDN
ncbi:unnamed protein product, partial [Ilex paraguariensis]